MTEKEYNEMRENGFETNFSRTIAAACLIAAPVLLLIGDLAGYAPELFFARYILCKSALTMFVFAIFVLVQILRPQAERLSLTAGGMAIIGAISGTALFSFAYFAEELNKAGLDAAAMQTAENLLRQVYMTMVFVPLPGLFLPIGLTILSIGLFLTRTVSRPAAAALGIGAILFPFGRIPGILTVSVVSDIFLAASMGFIAFKILNSSATVWKQKQALSDI